MLPTLKPLAKTVLLHLVLTSAFLGCENSNSTPDQDELHVHTDNHGHVHSPPRFGGQISEIGHTHGTEGLIFYYAEALPDSGNTVRLYISSEDEQGNSTNAEIDGSSVLAYLAGADEDSRLSRKITFTATAATDDPTVTFLTAEIPKDLRDTKQLSLVCPKIVLGGQRSNFMLSIDREHDPVGNTPESNPETDPDTLGNGDSTSALPPCEDEDVIPKASEDSQ